MFEVVCLIVVLLCAIAATSYIVKKRDKVVGVDVAPLRPIRTLSDQELMRAINESREGWWMAYRASYQTKWDMQANITPQTLETAQVAKREEELLWQVYQDFKAEGERRGWPL